MELRPYQRECLKTLRSRYLEGRRRVLVCLPTGTGKTVIFAHFPRFFSMKRRLLILAHREELLEQAAQKFQAVDPSLRVGIEQGGRRAGDASVVVASVPSLRGPRLEALATDEFFLVVVDEAHHAVAPTYRTIFDHLGLFEPGTRKMLVGFTATPRRGDRQSLGDVFEEIAFSQSLEEMIARGFLCRIAGWRVRSAVDLDGVKVRHGDFMESQLAHAVNTPERNALVVSSYMKLAAGRPCVAFCADVAHAQTLARAFSHAGFTAESLSGETPRDRRREILARFRAGEVRVVTNCMVLTEGFDEPSVSCVLMARPTQSLLLYAQMVGRGTRLSTGKSELLVIDVADNTQKHSLAGLHLLFDLPLGLDLRGGDAFAISKRLRHLARAMPWIDLSRIRRPEELDVIAERIDLIRLDPPNEIASLTAFAWVGTPSGGYRLPIPGGNEILVQPTALGGFEVLLRAGRAPVAAVARGGELAHAIHLADDLVRRKFPDARKVLERSAAWRERPATEKQLALLQRRKLPVLEKLNRGQAAALIAWTSHAPRVVRPSPGRAAR
jgi:superfamily II DNA or RNA helicase